MMGVRRGRLASDFQEGLSPWEEDTKIPEMYLHSSITPSKKKRALNATALVDFKPKRIERQTYTFKSHPTLAPNTKIPFL